MIAIHLNEQFIPLIARIRELGGAQTDNLNLYGIQFAPN